MVAILLWYRACLMLKGIVRGWCNVKVKFTFVDWVVGNKFVRGGWRWVVRHTLLLATVGAIMAFVVYRYLIKTRIDSGVFHGDAGLIAASELTWFAMGGLLYLSLGLWRARLRQKKRRGRRK